MTTNCICTIARAGDDDSIIVWQGECMWQEVKGAEVKKFGEERADSVRVYIPDVTADIAEDDMIIRGYADGERTLRQGFTVRSVARNDYGSESMRHIALGVK